jgi:hypothetical protein
LGCSGVGQKIDKWQTVVKEKLNFSTDTDKKNSDVYFIHSSSYSWETLGYVADWYTGDAKNWKILAKINPDVEPQKVAVGSEIFIPVDLLKTRKPLPQNFAAGYCKNCYQHTVRWPGESLSLIARWYTGSSKNWRKLAKANPRINPNRIRKGNVILIPSALLKNKEPLPHKVAAKYTSGYFAHTVKQTGEKMKVIARWYTGSAANWKAIAKANPKLNPDRLMAGNEIYIPSKLLKTRKPIPTAESSPLVKQPESKPPADEKKITPVEDEEIKIFGPKQFPKS